MKTNLDELLRGSQTLLDLIEWLRDKLRRLDRGLDTADVPATLRALAHACDPQSNPRLKQVVDDLESIRRARVGGARS